ncbi:hypothetical protein Nepgr_011448 [Nepenthes gracilis]|uniref:Uncharacterized protein n=1 Tax=Nepenthes gracilis TaxID=150966 RepID=A0AAD3SEC9_NEPGR|nr:hypothetical protein Nepgr_011448 [Nepenthes gracilis]
MNSIFSSFEVFGAELLGHVVKYSSMTNKDSRSETDDSRGSRRGSGGGRSSFSSPAPAYAREASPRFALELDGLNCFETVVLH